MNGIAYTLIGDGSSDRALVPILNWLLQESGVGCAIQPTWGDLSRLGRRPSSLAEKICRAFELYPCDLMFVHRDAESTPPDERRSEVVSALKSAEEEIGGLIGVPVIPVKMTEAWLMFSEDIIRKASGNPRGSNTLSIPSPDQWEQVSNPKAVLHDLLREACGLGTRRRGALNVYSCARRIPELADDFSALRRLAAFRLLEDGIRQVVADKGWGG